MSAAGSDVGGNGGGGSGPVGGGGNGGSRGGTDGVPAISSSEAAAEVAPSSGCWDDLESGIEAWNLGTVVEEGRRCNPYEAERPPLEDSLLPPLLAFSGSLDIIIGFVVKLVSSSSGSIDLTIMAEAEETGGELALQLAGTR